MIQIKKSFFNDSERYNGWLAGFFELRLIAHGGYVQDFQTVHHKQSVITSDFDQKHISLCEISKN